MTNYAYTKVCGPMVPAVCLTVAGIFGRSALRAIHVSDGRDMIRDFFRSQLKILFFFGIRKLYSLAI